MSDITTDSCKDYLVNYFSQKNVSTLKKDWKRDRKYKNDQGEDCRDFSHPVLGHHKIVERAGVPKPPHS